MERFYIVTNEYFLRDARNYRDNLKDQVDFMKSFFDKNGIAGELYHIKSNEGINCFPSDEEMHSIQLYIEANKENLDKFNGQLLKETTCIDGNLMCKFKSGSKLLHQFQKECVYNGIVVNLREPREGQYFEKLQNGTITYSVARFEHNENYYLQVMTFDSTEITPICYGFNEIKGSEFYLALEEHNTMEDLDKNNTKTFVKVLYFLKNL